jgi:delta24(24(1))-sterol reductase
MNLKSHCTTLFNLFSFQSVGMALNARNRNPAVAENTVATPPSRSDGKSNSKYIDGESDEFEFGGSFGAASLMIFFPLLMWYMWIGATYYDGQFPTPEPDQSWDDFFHHLAHLVYKGAYPTTKAWAIYWTFFIFEALMSVISLVARKAIRR